MTALPARGRPPQQDCHGDDEAVREPANRLNQAIEIVKLMKQTFELSVKQVAETDQQTATALGDAGTDL